MNINLLLVFVINELISGLGLYDLVIIDKVGTLYLVKSYYYYYFFKTKEMLEMSGDSVVG